MSSLKRRFTSNVLAYLKAEGIDRAELARRSGVSESMLSRLINEERAPTLDTVEKIARGLKIPPAFLLEEQHGSHADILYLWRVLDGMPEEERRRIIEDAELRRAYLEDPKLRQRVSRR